MSLKLTHTLLSQRASPRSFFMSYVAIGMLALLFILNATFFPTLSEALSANGSQLFEKHQYWRAFTAQFVHADFSHLGSNSVFFGGLILLLYTYCGSIIFPGLSLVAGGFINAITLWFYPPQVSLVGISGVIYFMAGFWLVLYMGAERRLSFTRRLINAVAIGLIFLFPEAIEQRVSYLAHGVGFLLGVPSGLVYFLWNKHQIRKQEAWIYKEPEVIPDWYLEETGS